jgi:hypothetical protein
VPPRVPGRSHCPEPGRSKPTAYAEQVHDIFYRPPPPDAPPPIAPIAPQQPPSPPPFPHPPRPLSPRPYRPQPQPPAQRAPRRARRAPRRLGCAALRPLLSAAVVGGNGGMVVVAIDSGASPHLGHMLRLE